MSSFVPDARASPRQRRRHRLHGSEGPQGPWVLGIESGGEHLGVALWRLPETPGSAPQQWRLVDEVLSHRGHRHADSVLALIDAVLHRHGVAADALGLIAAGRGPGGFTGVRVGLASAVGLSIGTGVAVWPVDSLAALAQHAAGLNPGGLVIPMFDAKRGEIYGAAYEVDAYGEAKTVLAPQVASCERFLSAVDETAGTEQARLIFGSGALTYEVASAVPPSWHVAAPRHSAALAARAWDAASRDPSLAPPVDPSYVRKSDAELQTPKV
jgi:tRNA threonylcarbamoyl adenosine modification protein YeaZ